MTFLLLKIENNFFINKVLKENYYNEKIIFYFQQ